VELATARRIAEALPPFVARVGVFVDADAAELARTADAVGLDLLQLHGSEAPAACQAAPRRVMKAVGVGPGFVAEAATRYRDVAAAVLLDTRTGGQPGGTGRRFDWSLVLGLAGGLDAGNVAEAVREVSPDLVDVSSGVESAPGRKDADKVRAFVAAVREARP
jgi:phosphoribosylanthranilate isomerase